MPHRRHWRPNQKPEEDASASLLVARTTARAGTVQPFARSTWGALSARTPCAATARRQTVPHPLHVTVTWPLQVPTARQSPAHSDVRRITAPKSRRQNHGCPTISGAQPSRAPNPQGSESRIQANLDQSKPIGVIRGSSRSIEIEVNAEMEISRDRRPCPRPWPVVAPWLPPSSPPSDCASPPPAPSSRP